LGGIGAESPDRPPYHFPILDTVTVKTGHYRRVRSGWSSAVRSRIFEVPLSLRYDPSSGDVSLCYEALGARPPA